MIKICVSNEKGGCAKTTTAVNLSAILAEKEKRVLLVDADPQAYASYRLGLLADYKTKGLYEGMFEGVPLKEIIKPTEFGFDFVGSNRQLHKAKNLLVECRLNAKPYLTFFRDLMSQLSEDSYDYLIVDAPPEQSYLLDNLRVYCDNLLIPVQPDIDIFQSLKNTQESVTELRRNINPNIKILGSLVVMSEKNEFRQICEKFAKDSKFFRFFDTSIPKNIALVKCSAEHKPINKYDRRSRGYKGYKAVAEEIIMRTGA